ncbi:MAG: esterase [Pseudonocardiales bacterium]|nr:MAG: esterase [Pseudonocardiales bacterium]
MAVRGMTTHLGPVTVRPGFEHQQLVDRLAIEILTCEVGLVVGRMPVAGNRQPFGILHGGANAVLAETLGSLGAYLHADVVGGGQAVGHDLSCTHHRWVAGGHVTGVCTPLHEGHSSASYQIVISDDSGVRTCTALLSCAISPASTHRRCN